MNNTEERLWRKRSADEVIKDIEDVKKKILKIQCPDFSEQFNLYEGVNEI